MGHAAFPSSATRHQTRAAQGEHSVLDLNVCQVDRRIGSLQVSSCFGDLLGSGGKAVVPNQRSQSSCPILTLSIGCLGAPTGGASAS